MTPLAQGVLIDGFGRPKRAFPQPKKLERKLGRIAKKEKEPDLSLQAGKQHGCPGL